MTGSRPRVGLVDYGMGNRRSVEKALQHIGAEVAVTSEVRTLSGCSGLVIPGVGAFPRAMASLHELGLIEPIRSLAAEGRPILGICLGMQLLFEGSEEIEPTAGLGLLPGQVTWLAGTERLPHIGWNEVRFEQPSALLQGLPEQGVPFYHVHSLAARPARSQDTVGTTEYGERFATIVSCGNVSGVQFHPEKSSAHGLTLLSNFVRLCQDAAQNRVGLAAPA